MTGKPDVIRTLQAALAQEAHLNLQYRLDRRSVKWMGVKKIGKKLASFGDDAHHWMKLVTDRIQFMEGDPSYSVAPVTEAKTITDLLQNELSLEMAVLAPYEQAIQVAMKAFDDGSRNLFEHLIKFHQKHVAWLEIQLRLIVGLGEKEYVAEKV